jgi:cyclophilin family peptidyl-prolyl cis-trans isomerase
MRWSVFFALCLAAMPACLGQTAAVQMPEEPGLYAVFKTSMGTMVALLYDDKAPVTVKNFVALARGEIQTLDKRGKPVKKPYFDGLTFHRVIKNFMIQGGDIKGTGAGNCGVPTIVDEFDKTLTFEYPGRLAMANTGRPHTGNCQFFITVARPTHLDGKHTIFGQVMSGLEVAMAISEVPTGSDDKPVKPVVIESVTIVRK